MEATDASHLDEIWDALERAGHPTGVMVQIGTRNAQNYELLKQVGRQQEFPVLFKRGMGITLEESLNACEYVASEGNAAHRLLPARRQVAPRRASPQPGGLRPRPGRAAADQAPGLHRSLAQRRQRPARAGRPCPTSSTRSAQGVVAGASAVLVDFHPHPERALCDGGQALTLDMLEPLLEHVRRMRAAYEGSVAAMAEGEAERAARA